MVNFRLSMTREILEGRLDIDDRRVHHQNQGSKTTGKAKVPNKAKHKTKNDFGTQKKTANQEHLAEDMKQEGKDTEDGRKDRIEFPKANSAEWGRLDNDLTHMLKIRYAPPEIQAQTHPELIYILCRERFGAKVNRESKPQTSGPSKRQVKCQKLRSEINQLKETYRNAPEEEKEAIKQLQDDKLKRLRLAKRAETMKRNRKKFSKNCNKFLSQPFEFAREVIAPKPKGQLQSNKEEVETHLKKSHSDPERERKRTIPDDLPQYEEPEVDFNNKPPSWREFTTRLRKTRSKSAPGPNGVPYQVYKRCPGVARLLWQYLCGLWKKNLISDKWRRAEGIFIPKEDGATEVEKHRTISLLNVEGKIYFALRADRLLKFSLANNYIDTSVQKGGVPGVSGCLEHTSILSQLIREAKAEKKDLVVTWIDIANAYGSMPHSLILTALRRTHVPEDICKLVESYYSDVKIRFTTKEFTTEWQTVEKGIITGCTMSVVLFSLAMTMLVMSVDKETKGPKTSSGQQQKNSRLFMDDIASTTLNLVCADRLLVKLFAKFKWAGLEGRPDKCRSLVIIKGEVSKRTPVIDGVAITSITEKPVKHLGKQYNKSLNEKEQIEDAMKECEMCLKKIERCKLPGQYKAWMLQHMLLPRMMWPLTIYNIPMTKVSEIQKQMTSKLKKWLGLPRSLSVESLYTKSGKLQLPFSELTEEVKASKARVLVTLEESDDPCVKNAAIKVDGGTKADTPKSVKEAKTKLRMQEITGIANRGREGLGMNPKKYYSTSSKKDKRAMIVKAVRETEEDRRFVKMTSLAKQGVHTKWEVPERKLTHQDLISMSETRIKFLIKSVYDLLPTPENKNVWFGTEEVCKLCGGKGTLPHILNGCSIALSQGRYKWRHDQVLREIATYTEARRKIHNNNPKPLKTKDITFVKKGEKAKPQTEFEPKCYLDSASDWRLIVDLDGRLKVPEEVAITNLRPDMLLISDKTKKMGVVELTVPGEERIEVSGELKRTKYAGLQEEGRKNGWLVQIWAIEVGCRGFPAASMASFLKEIGIQGNERRRKLKRIGEVAENASRSIWRWSHFKSWGSD